MISPLSGVLKHSLLACSAVAVLAAATPALALGQMSASRPIAFGI